MGLVDEITNAVAEALDGDLEEASITFLVTHYVRSPSNFDSSSGAVTIPTESFYIRGIQIKDTESDEASLGAKPDELKVLCLTQELGLAGSEIQINDTLTDPYGVTRTIYKRDFDPIKATTTFYLKGGS